jgi:hypothetical protein
MKTCHSDWNRKGVLYAKENPKVVEKPHTTEPPPHAPDFYRAVLTILAKDNFNWLFARPSSHPFWQGLGRQLMTGAIQPEEIKSPIVWNALAASEDSEDEVLDVVTEASGNQSSTYKPLAALCHEPHVHLGMRAPRSVLNAMAIR